VNLARISFNDAYWLLEQQTGGVLPPETADASWYASSDRNVLGTVILDRRDGSHRFVLLQRQGDGGRYSRRQAGQDYSTQTGAENAMRLAA